MDAPLNNFGRLQTAKNIIANALFFVITTLITLWYTPFLIQQLGSELFGFIPLATSVVSYFSIITYSLNVSVGRSITIELEKGNTLKANQIFNTNLVITILLISITMPLGVILVIFAPQLFNIPHGLEKDVQHLFAGIIIAFLLGTYRLNYSLAAFAKNRFDLRNLVALGGRIAQILVIVALFKLEEPKLIYVGFGVLCAALFDVLGNYYLWRILLPVLKNRWRDFDKGSLKLLFGTGIWAFFYQAGFILFLNVDMLIANWALDLKTAGMYGALLVIPKNLRIMSFAIGGVWGPSILAKYSRADSQGVDMLVRTAIKLTGLTLALVIGLGCGFASSFLNLWLGTEFQAMTWVLILMIFPLSTNLISVSFYNVYIAQNKLKMPALVILGLGLSNLLLAIFLAPRYGAIGIVLASALMLTLNNSIFAPIYTAKTMKLPWWHYIQYLGRVMLITLSIASISYLFSISNPPTSFLHLIISSGFIALGYLLFTYLFLLSKEEQRLIKGFLPYIKK